MKKVLRTIWATIIITMLMSFLSFAATNVKYDYSMPIEIKSKVLDPVIKKSTAIARAIKRGEFFSAAELSIINENGNTGVDAHAYMGAPVDELYITIYVDQLNKETNKWSQVALYDFEYYGEDYPDGLTWETVYFIIDNQPKGYYYRLRGSFAALKDGAMEGFGPVTDGVLIE